MAKMLGAGRWGGCRSWHNLRARRPQLRRTTPVLVAIVLLFAAAASAQEMEPRTFSPSPVGTNFVVFAVNHATGSVLVDPSLPVTDIHASNTVNVLGLGHVFDLFGRQALITGVLPYANADVTGNVGGNAREVQRSGLADAQAKLSVLLLGGKALTPGEFAQAHHGMVIGVSVGVMAPTGQYYPQYLINLGTNRWATRLEGGISIPRGRWMFEGSAGVGLYGDNDLFYPGERHKSQQSIKGLQGHVSYTFRPRMWVAFDGTWYTGGRVDLDGVRGADFQRNSRLGATFALPLTRRQSLKFAYSTGATTRLGGDFDTFSVAYQMVWFGKRPTPPQVAPPPGGGLPH